ncbi:thiamine pyrophosphate-binding protein [Luteolibacter algae]|uniref:Thiamine pyrophosphate-binding protein n=1 Tax=Luteolibacter algae TaxID=454151 RepID=A0ABW5D4E1_9BACT
MNTWETAVGILEQAVKAGTEEFVVCGGARNAVLLEVLAKMENAGKVKIWSHFEERSAGFFALGRTMQTGRSCAVVVTSGTAVAELLPSVVEAYYQARPLVLITADRPASYRGSGAPQAIEQVGVFSSYAAASWEGWDGMAPLHINVELEEEFEIGGDDFSSLEAGEFSIDYGRPRVGELARWLRERTLGGMVVMLGDLELSEQEEVFHFCEALGAPVVAEATSGLREALQHLLLVEADKILKENPPEKILRLGGVPSCRFWRDLEGLEKISVWSVCRNGLRGLGREANVLKGALDRVLPALGEIEKIGDRDELLDGVEGRGMRLEESLEAFPDSEPGWVRTLSVFSSIGSGVYLGNSLPLREWNAYAQWERPVRNVRANRGANGIDGQLSSWLGVSAGEENAWGIFGDLTTLYDLAALKLLPQVECRGRVLVVINNGGGKIFERVPRLEGMSDAAKSWMAAEAPVNFEALARAWGMDFQRVCRVDEFDGVMAFERAVMLEVVPDSAQTAAFLR